MSGNKALIGHAGMRRAALALLTVLVLARSANAQQNLTWDTNGVAAGTGGTGILDTTALIWFNGTTFQAWNNATFDNGIFGGTVGTVTVGTPINVHNLTFLTNGYSLTGSTLTLGGVTPTVTTNPAVTTTIGAVIDGASGLVKAGTGTLSLTGTNTYSGGTTISAGTLQVGNGGTTGSIVGDVIDNGALALNRSDAADLRRGDQWDGHADQGGHRDDDADRRQHLQRDNHDQCGHAAGGQWRHDGPVGHGRGRRQRRAGVQPQRRCAHGGGVISGTGTVTQLGTGTTTLTGANTYTGTTTISAGTLQVGNGGTTGQLGTGAVVDNATLTFNRSNALTVATAISGTGAVTKAGTGTTTLTGANTYSGGTTISAGTLQVGQWRDHRQHCRRRNRQRRR